MQRLLQGTRKWQDLEHINVLPLFGTTMGLGRLPAMVFPWLENGPLTHYLERSDDSLTTGERLVLARIRCDFAIEGEPDINIQLVAVAMGLQYLHSRSVVHDDLSGMNVLMHGNGRACIANFGLSTLLTELGGSTFPTFLQTRGTLRWTAPELLDLQVSENEEDSDQVVPTPQCDIYSFGGIML
ncbi:kinase-like protein [Gyrodon lividus]|nr:kinase-like protein [Gyrodon lividus]